MTARNARAGGDIVERLRRHPVEEWEGGVADDITDAATEIERLRVVVQAGIDWLEVVSPPAPGSMSAARMDEFRRLAAATDLPHPTGWQPLPAPPEVTP